MKRKWTIPGIALAAVCLAALPAGAQPGLGGPDVRAGVRDGSLFDPHVSPTDASAYFDSRVGLAQFVSLRVGQGARGEALGGAYTAIADDITASFWNPAGLAHIERVGYAINYTRWLANSQFLSGALAFNAGFGVIGFNVISFAAEKFEVTTPTAPWGSGTFAQVGDIAIGAMFAKQMTDKFMLGGQIRWVQEDLYLEKVATVDYSVGTFFYTGYKTVRIAMAFQNLGPNVKTTEGGTISSMPTVYSLAGAMEVFGRQGDPGYATLSVEHSFITDYRAVTRVGAEVWLQNTLALRAGYRSHMELEKWSLGGGLRRKVMPGKTVSLDFSYHHQEKGVFDSPLRVSLGGTF